jgi:hypothetical protein
MQSQTDRYLQSQINLKLRADGLKVKKTRGARALVELGEYYVLDICTNTIVRHHTNLAYENLLTCGLSEEDARRTAEIYQ